MQEYFEEYEKFIYNSIEAEAEPLTGEDLENTMNDAKETAAGLDQWTPADLRMLSPKAYEALAKMLNEIERRRKGLAKTDANCKGCIPPKRRSQQPGPPGIQGVADAPSRL